MIYLCEDLKTLCIQKKTFYCLLAKNRLLLLTSICKIEYEIDLTNLKSIHVLTAILMGPPFIDRNIGMYVN